jgi:hypothetical protein
VVCFFFAVTPSIAFHYTEVEVDANTLMVLRNGNQANESSTSNWCPGRSYNCVETLIVIPADSVNWHCVKKRISSVEKIKASVKPDFGKLEAYFGKMFEKLDNVTQNELTAPLEDPKTAWEYFRAFCVRITNIHPFMRSDGFIVFMFGALWWSTGLFLLYVLRRFDKEDGKTRTAMSWHERHFGVSPVEIVQPTNISFNFLHNFFYIIYSSIDLFIHFLFDCSSAAVEDTSHAVHED